MALFFDQFPCAIASQVSGIWLHQKRGKTPERSAWMLQVLETSGLSVRQGLVIVNAVQGEPARGSFICPIETRDDCIFALVAQW